MNVLFLQLGMRFVRIIVIQKINYNTELSECYGGYKFYDITTDKYKCLYNDLALYNIADKI